MESRFEQLLISYVLLFDIQLIYVKVNGNEIATRGS